MKKLLLKPSFFGIALVITCLFLTNMAVGQTTYYSRASTAWNLNTTWSLTSGGVAVGAGIFPIAGDIVNIEGGFNVTIPASVNMACATLNVTSANAGNGTLIFSAGSSLAVSANATVGTAGTTKAGTITMNLGGVLNIGGNLTLGSNAACNITQGIAAATINVTGTATVLQPLTNNTTNAWNVNLGTATVTGLFTLDGTDATGSRDASLLITTGTFNANGGIQINGVTAATKNISVTTGSLNIGGTGISNAAATAFSSGSGTVRYNAAGSQANVAGYTYYNLLLSGSGTKTLLATADIDNILTVNAETIFNIGAFAITPDAVDLQTGAATAGSSITGTGLITLGGNIGVTSAGAGTGGASITAPVALGGSARVFTINTGGGTSDLFLGGIVSGANSFTKAGTGILEYGAANTYTNTTVITGGILRYAANNAILTGAINVNGGKLDISSFSDAVGVVTLTTGEILGTTGVLTGSSYILESGTVSAILAGTGTLAKNTTGTVTISSVNTYTGKTTINDGTLSINSLGNLSVASALGAPTTVANGTIDIVGGTNTILQYTGSGHSSNRVININNDANVIEASGSGTLTLTGGITGSNDDLIITGTGLAVESGVIATGSLLTKNGTGTWQLAGINTYTGLTTINAGTLQYGVSNAISTGAITINGGTLDIAGFSDGVGAVTLTTGSILGTTGVLTGTSYAVASGTISAILAGTGGLTKTTAGTVTLSGVNTYTGVTTITLGILSVGTIGNGGVAGNIGAAAVAAGNLVLNGGTLQYTGATASTNRNFTLSNGTTSTINVVTNDLTISGASANNSGNLIKIGNGTLILSGANLHTGLTTVADRTLEYGANNVLTGAITVDNGILDIKNFSDAVGAVTLIDGEINGTSGVLTGTSYALQDGIVTAILGGTGALTKTTTGTVVLSGVNTYTGVTNINAGILSVATIGDGGVASNLGAAAVAATNLVLGGGTLRYTGATASTNKGASLTNATTSIINITANDLTISGAITGSTGALTKTGNGILVFSGANTYTGATTISTGILRLGASERIANGGTLVVDGTFDMNGFSETIGALSGSSTGIITSGAVGTILLTVGNTTSTSYAGIIENGSATSLALTKIGSGTLALSGSNTYTGLTTITAGTILLAAADVLPNNAVSLGGGTLNTGTSGGFSETIGDLTVAVNAAITLGTGVHTLTIANSSANTWAATLLTINGWTGLGGSGGGGTAGKIIVGVGGLTPAQLNKIAFTGFTVGAVITPSGELVPNSGVFYSQGSLTPTSISSWNSIRGGGGATPANFTSGNTFVIQDLHTMTTSAAWTVSGTGSKVLIEDGGTLVATNAITLAAGTVFQIEDNGTYTHNNTGIPTTTIFTGTENFAPNSNVRILNWPNNSTVLNTGVTMPFGNLEINWNSGGTWSQSLTGSLTYTAGNFTITSLGAATNEFRLTPASTGTALTFGIGGNLTVGTGTLVLVGGGSAGTKAGTVNVTGNVSITGTIDMNSNAASSGAVALNVGGNFSVTGSGVLKNTLGSGTRTFNFNKATGNQTFTSTASGINTSSIVFNVGTGATTNTLQLLSGFIMANAASLNVLNNATLNCGTNIVQATVANTQGNFNLSSAATILIGSTGGISATGATGNIQTGTTRIFNAGANYIYNGAAPQSSGTGLTTANNLEINNASGVTLSVNATVNNILTLTAGNINSAANTLSVSNNAVGAIVRTSGHIIGNLQRAIATGANIYNYPVGNATDYLPASLVFSSVGGAGSITVKTADGAGTNYPASLSATKRLNRNWVVTNTGVTGFTVNASFTFIAGDLIGGVTTSELKTYRADPGVVYTYASPADYSISGTTFNYNNLNSFSGTAGFSEFGAGGCKASFAPTFTKTMASACGGGSDGTITVTPAGGTSPFTYSWTGPGGYTANTSAITGLGAGDYTVVITEVTGCTKAIPDITIWQTLAPFVTSNGTPSGSCAPTGSITLFGSYGVPPFTYSIDGVIYQAGSTFTNVAVGTYTGYVKDLRGCIGTKPNIVIPGAAPLAITAFTRNASSCANNGSIELYRTGGIGPYTYSLNDVTYQSSNTFNSLAGGTYTGWVKDSKGCKTSLTGIVVTQAPVLTVTASKINTSTCVNDGSIKLNAGGGVPGYTYSLDNITYQAGQSFGGLGAGSYTGWVKDLKGCTSSVAVTINLNPIVVTAFAANSTACVGNNGSIQLFRTGGFGPYTYSLDDITYQASNTFTGLAGGTYTGWVKDSRNCKSSLANIIISQVPPVSVTAGFTHASTCINDGTIQLRPAGGVPGYTYSLDDISYQAGSSFGGLAAGNYTGWVKDAVGCKASINITILNNPISVTSYAAPASDCVTANGSIQLFRTGGKGPYTYSLDGIVYQSSNLFTGLNAGDYSGYVKDVQSCIGVQANINVGPNCAKPVNNTVSRSNTTGNNNTITFSANSVLKINAYPNPSSSEFTLLLEGNSKGKVSVMVTDILGKKLYQSESSVKQLHRFGNNFKAGIYIVQVTQGDNKQSLKIIKE